MEVEQGTRSDERAFDANAQRQRYRGWRVKRRRKIAARDHHIPLAFISSEARVQKLISTPPLMQFMKQIVPSMLALVALKYLVKTESPFLENPVTVWCFIAAFCVYWLTAEAMKRMTTLNHKWMQIASRVALASGILSAFSLLSVLLSYPFSLLPIIIWIPLAKSI